MDDVLCPSSKGSSAISRLSAEGRLCGVVVADRHDEVEQVEVLGNLQGDGLLLSLEREAQGYGGCGLSFVLSAGVVSHGVVNGDLGHGGVGATHLQGYVEQSLVC